MTACAAAYWATVIIQGNWSYQIQVFKIAAKAGKDKTQEQSQRVKNNNNHDNLNRCVLAF